jgi:hypothetical protein
MRQSKYNLHFNVILINKLYKMRVLIIDGVSFNFSNACVSIHCIS